MTDKLFENYPNLSQASTFTRQKINELRERLADHLADTDGAGKMAVVATGSYGRMEATEWSDLDLFIILDKRVARGVVSQGLQHIEEVTREVVPNAVGDTGTFGAEAVTSRWEMLQNIGGSQDENANLTRRMLFLLEGTCLYGEELYGRCRTELISKYIKDNSPENQIPRFLLNDIIRYYRTITTDFEFKVTEGGKDWGLRNVKLKFSRKLLYFGGIIVVAEMLGLDHKERIRRAGELFAMPVLERIAQASVDAKQPDVVFSAYEKFIECLARTPTRDVLKKLPKKDRQQCKEFQDLRELGEKFSLHLADWLARKYSADHPIHHALIF